MIYVVRVPTKDNSMRLMAAYKDNQTTEMLSSSYSNLRKVGWITYHLSRGGSYRLADYLAIRYGVNVL